jgi:hypothetical protein
MCQTRNILALSFGVMVVLVLASCNPDDTTTISTLSEKKLLFSKITFVPDNPADPVSRLQSPVSKLPSPVSGLTSKYNSTPLTSAL